ncbi:DnaJ protein, putative [Plasmodium sp. gorilla clade G2]|uniref:DnaJ protein, putative n=1 Tax=Plasmodium sp. gorilla clade G2 TaxID=880535 RepID=UPI000D203790|nr:DnaJ protein, putative [Plasmodium sp. gorilla clade G2]SOV11847.1 DnaJ protein, putative [Plasmodium sp. gorilla clade G2]
MDEPKNVSNSTNFGGDVSYDNNKIVPKYNNNYETEKEEKNLISNIFSTRRPKHAGAGLVSGIKSVTKGIIVGTSFLFISPYLCAKAEGINGFFKGMFFGLLSAIIIPVVSLGVASYQIGRGIINTPESITQRALGKIWDDEKREWYDFYYNLDEEANELLNITDDNKNNKYDRKKEGNNDEYYNKNGNIKVKNDEFYRILKVPTDASQNEIKRQYYKLAKEFHPDKCSDLKAKEQFQKIGEAYQVLGDVERRRRYDKEGKNAINNMQFIDSTFFFTLLFGSEKLDPYIGKLRMVMYVEYEQLYKDEDVQRLIVKEQNKREVKLALHLRDMVNNYIFGDPDDYIIKFSQQIKELCQTSFGHIILENVAWSYENCANQFLGEKYSLFGISGKYYKMQQKKRVIGTGFKFVKTLIKTSSLANQIRKKEDDDDISYEKTAKVNKKIEDSLPTIVETMLNICLIDIDQTIKGVCKKVFTDMGVDENMRKTRAETLIILAKIMKKIIHDFKKNTEITDTKKLFEDACMRACQKQDDDYI